MNARPTRYRVSSSNLQSMGRDPAARMRIAKTFLASGESQTSFAKRVDVPVRTLRSWLAQLRPRDPEGKALDIVRKARADLDALLQVMEAAAGGRSLSSRSAVTTQPVASPVPTEHVARQEEAAPVARQPAAAEVATPSPVPPNEPAAAPAAQPGHGGQRTRRTSFFADL